ncbi:MAG: hypothetical protein GY940_21910, partial [bacterium]|nr:hypothetical protein [bacterium]
EIPFKNEDNDVSVLKEPEKINVQYAVIEQIQIDDNSKDFRYHLVVVKGSGIDEDSVYQQFGTAKFAFWKKYQKNTGKLLTETKWGSFVSLTRNWLVRNPLAAAKLYKTRHIWHKAHSKLNKKK